MIGKLAFACKVIPAGHIFIQCLLDTAHLVDGLPATIVIDDDAAQDIHWWLPFAQSWNGTALFLQPDWMPAHHLQLYTDTASITGFSAYWNGEWFAQRWPLHLYNKSIGFQELYAIVMACEAWGHQWATKRILFHCDNIAVVQVSHAEQT